MVTEDCGGCRGGRRTTRTESFTEYGVETLPALQWRQKHSAEIIVGQRLPWQGADSLFIYHSGGLKISNVEAERMRPSPCRNYRLLVYASTQDRQSCPLTGSLMFAKESRTICLFSDVSASISPQAERCLLTLGPVTPPPRLGPAPCLPTSAAAAPSATAAGRCWPGPARVSGG